MNKKTLVLDYSKWRSGGDSNDPNIMCGRGRTFLLNDEGYMCCLGQFATQLNPSISERDMLEYASPEGLDIPIPLLASKRAPGSDYREYVDTILSKKAMNINDSPVTTIETKIQTLKALFSRKGYEIKVINLPKNKKNEKVNSRLRQVEMRSKQ